MSSAENASSGEDSAAWEGSERDFGELVFGEFGDSLRPFLQRVHASLSAPQSPASKYMASIQKQLNCDSKLAKICIMTQAGIAFREAKNHKQPPQPVATAGSSDSDEEGPPQPPPRRVRQMHRVGVLNKQPTQFGPSKIISVAEAIAGSQPCYTILSSTSLTFIPELLCNANPIQAYTITANMQCAHLSINSNCISIDIPGKQFYVVAATPALAIQWANWINTRIDALHPQGASRKKKPMLPAFRKPSLPGSPSFVKTNDVVVDNAVIDRVISKLCQGDLDVMLELSLTREQVTLLRLLFEKFLAPGFTFISSASFEKVVAANKHDIPADAVKTVEAAMEESLSVTFSHFLRACGPCKEDFSASNLRHFQEKSLARLKQENVVKTLRWAGSSRNAVGKDAHRRDSASDLDERRRFAQSTADVMAAPLSQEEAITLVQRLYRAKMLRRRDIAECQRWMTAYAPDVFICFRALCDVTTGTSIGLLQCKQGDYLGAKVQDLAASPSGWCTLHDKDLNKGLVSMDHLELVADLSQFEHLFVALREKNTAAAKRRSGGGSKSPAPQLPPKRTSFKDEALINVPAPIVEGGDPNHVKMKVSKGKHFGVGLARAPLIADVRFAYEIPEILVAFEKAILPHASTVGLLRISGDQSEYETLKEQLERGEEIDTSIHTIANLLKIFFRSLSSNDRIFARLDAESLISGAAKGAATRGDVDFEAIVDKLKEPTRSVWWWFLGFASKIVDKHAVNQMTPTNISTCITPNFFPDFELASATPVVTPVKPKKKKGLFSNWKMPWSKRTPELSNAEKLRKFKMQSRRITANPLSQTSVSSMAQDPVAALKLMQQKNVFVANLIEWYSLRTDVANK